MKTFAVGVAKKGRGKRTIVAIARGSSAARGTVAISDAFRAKGYLLDLPTAYIVQAQSAADAVRRYMVTTGIMQRHLRAKQVRLPNNPTHIPPAGEKQLRELLERYGADSVLGEAGEIMAKKVAQRNPRGRRFSPAQLIFGDVAQWAIDAGIEPGDKIAYRGYAGRGLRGPEYKETIGKVALIGPQGPVVTRAGDRYGAMPVVVTQETFIRRLGKKNPYSKKAKYIHVRVRSPRRFVTRSLRTVGHNGRAIVGHLKGETRRTRSGRVKQAVQAVLRPKRGRRRMRTNPPLVVLGANPPKGAPRGRFLWQGELHRVPARA